MRKGVWVASGFQVVSSGSDDQARSCMESWKSVLEVDSQEVLCALKYLEDVCHPDGELIRRGRDMVNKKC